MVCKSRISCAMQSHFNFLGVFVLLIVATKESTGAEAPASNGLQCPTCWNNTSDSCQSELADCKGLETYCIDSSGSILKEDGSASSTFVAKGCITQFVLSALLGPENVTLGTYRFINVTVGEAAEVTTEAPTPEATTEATTPEATTEAPTPIAEKTSMTTLMASTTPNGSPQILSSLSFTLWLSSISWVLLVKPLS